jgi:hypothetical protein
MILSVMFPVLLALLTLPFTILRIILLGRTNIPCPVGYLKHSFGRFFAEETMKSCVPSL